MSSKIDSALTDAIVEYLPAELVGGVISRLLLVAADKKAAEDKNAATRADYLHLSTQFNIASQDRDARRRRMELAQLILDYEQTVPIDELWGIVMGLYVAVPIEQHTQNEKMRANTQPLWDTSVDMSDVQGRRADGSYGQPRPFGMPSLDPIFEVARARGVAVVQEGTDFRLSPDPTATPTSLHLHGGCDGNHAGPPCADPECWARDTCGNVAPNPDGLQDEKCHLPEGHSGLHRGLESQWA